MSRGTISGDSVIAEGILTRHFSDWRYLFGLVDPSSSTILRFHDDLKIVEILSGSDSLHEQSSDERHVLDTFGPSPFLLNCQS
jgi:hypothetical protein